MEGKTAVKYLRGGQKYIAVGDAEYVFIPNHNISLAWIDNEYVQRVLNMKRGCCGGSKKVQFVLASETDVRRHTFGGR